MLKDKLFLFDFDGVIVDGMNEYWHSSLLGCEKFLNSSDVKIEQNFYESISTTFREIRPWVKYGWEMVLIVHEILKKEHPLNDQNKKNFLDKYHQNCQKILKANNWLAEDLQNILDKSRKYQIEKDFEIWVKLHNPYHEVMDFIKQLKHKQIKTGIITTKGRIFASKILENLKIFPEFVFGYESGSKLKIAKELSEKFEIIGFIEDRRKTLLEIKTNQDTKDIPCYLADWGYLKESDRFNLPKEISLLKLKNIENLLAI